MHGRGSENDSANDNDLDNTKGLSGFTIFLRSCKRKTQTLPTTKPCETKEIIKVSVHVVQVTDACQPVPRQRTIVTHGNRSGGTNDYAAACWHAKSSAGSKEGAASSRRVAWHAAVR